MTAFNAVAAGLLGVAVGSFLNVVAYRVPLGLSVIRPPSACPSCGNSIARRDNIPVISWLLLRGRCRHCEARISIQYPLLELGGGLLWALTAAAVGLNWTLPAYLWFVSVTLALVATDLEHHRLPNKIVLHGSWVGAVLLAVGSLADGAGAGRAGLALGGAAVYFGLMFVLALLTRGGFGFGDVKMAAMLGLFVAYQPTRSEVGVFESVGAVAVAVFGAFLIGGLVAIVLLILKRRGRKAEIAFGPSMILAAWIAAVHGADIFEWYVGA